MKKTLRLATCLTLTAGLALLASCNDSQKERNDNQSTTFETYTGSSTYTLKNSAKQLDQDSDVVCNDSVALILPMVLDNTDAVAVRDSIMMLALGNANADANTAIKTWLETEARETGYETAPSDANPATADGFNHVKGYVVNLSPEMLVYCVTTDTYAPRAANGLTTNSYINYSMAQGKMLSLADLFTADGLKALPGLIAEQAESNPAYAGKVTIASLPEGNNYYLSSEGEIVFSFNPLEVGPHSLGTVDVAFYPYELVSYMTPEAITMFNLGDLK